jgi:hypothetical protein
LARSWRPPRAVLGVPPLQGGRGGAIQRKGSSFITRIQSQRLPSLRTGTPVTHTGVRGRCASSAEAARRRATASDQPGAASSSVPGETQLLESSESPDHTCGFCGKGAYHYCKTCFPDGKPTYLPSATRTLGQDATPSTWQDTCRSTRSTSASRRRPQRAPRHARLSARRHAPALVRGADFGGTTRHL